VSVHASLMPRRFARVRRGAFIVYGGVAALVAAAWLLSQFRGFAIIRETGTLVRIDAIPDGRMGAWEYTLTTWSFQTYPHQFRLVRGTYLSIMEREGEKDRFAEQLGWSTSSFPRFAIRPERNPWFRFGQPDWRILGMGTGETAGSGQISRTFDLPYWLPIVVFGTPLLLAAKRRRTLAKREREGRCLKCGYQLDAAMITCPECGTARTLAST